MNSVDRNVMKLNCGKTYIVIFPLTGFHGCECQIRRKLNIEFDLRCEATKNIWKMKAQEIAFTRSIATGRVVIQHNEWNVTIAAVWRSLKYFYEFMQKISHTVRSAVRHIREIATTRISLQFSSEFSPNWITEKSSFGMVWTHIYSCTCQFIL